MTDKQYQKLLEGLEVTIFNKKDIIADNEEFRIDSEYYKNEYLELYKKIEFAPILADLVTMSDLSSNGSFAYVAKILNDGEEKTIPFIRSGNVGDTFINQSELDFISNKAHLQLPKSTTYLHEIMMARKGKIGGASIILDEQVNFNCNENVIKFNITNKKELNPFYFTTYFNCKYGLKQIERISTGNVQPWVSIFQIRKLKIQVLSNAFQLYIEEVIKRAHSKLNQSKTLYAQAEQLLLEAVGLNAGSTPFRGTSSTNYNVKSFKESFAETGRLDAEYYQKKYEEILALIKKQNNDKLGNLVSISKSVEPGSDAYQETGIPFIRVSNITKYGLTAPEIHLDAKKFADVIRPKKDTILLSKDGTVGIAYKVTEDLDYITSSALLHLTVTNKKILPDYLTLVLNSQLTQLQAERDAGGSIIQHWKPSEIAEVIIPIIDETIQQKISQLIQESFALKTQSQQLLQLAKQAVEVAIEDGEDRGMELLKN